MSRLPILTFHAIGSGGEPTSTSLDQFRRIVDTLVQEGGRCVDLRSWIVEGRPCVERGFALTFDDGLGSILEAVNPLRKAGFTATIFVVAGRVGTDNDWPRQPAWVPRERLLGWDELVDLRRQGFSTGAHSMTHPRRITAANSWEISASKASIEAELGESCGLFAYPYGEVGSIARRSVERDFNGGVTTWPAVATSSHPASVLPRLDAYDLRTPDAVRRVLRGGIPADLAIRRWGRAGKRRIGIA